MKKLNIFETFAGIGSQHKALENLKNKSIIDDYEILGISEWYISAIIAYTLIHYNDEFYKKLKELEVIFNINEKKIKDFILNELKLDVFSTNSKDPSNLKRLKLETLKQLYVSMKISKNYGSVVSLKSEKMPKNIDVLTYSFPCQDLSNAGLKKGLEVGTRSGLIWEIGRIVKGLKEQDRPNVLLMENVPTLFNRFKDGWDIWKDELDKIGYDTYQTKLISSNFNIPQMRVRAFAISVKRNGNINKEYLKNFNLDKEISKTKTYINAQMDIKLNGRKNLKSILDKNIDFKYYIDKPFEVLKSTDGKTGVKFDLIDHSTYEIANRIYYTDYMSPTLTTGGFIKIYENEDDKIIRHIKEVEAFRLMGFKTEDYNKVEKYFTKGHLYKFAGNSIVVDVLESLFEVIDNIIEK